MTKSVVDGAERIKFLYIEKRLSFVDYQCEFQKFYFSLN